MWSMGEMPWTCSPLLEWRFLVRFGIGCCTHDILHNKSICFFVGVQCLFWNMRGAPGMWKPTMYCQPIKNCPLNVDSKKRSNYFQLLFLTIVKKNMVRKRIKKGFYCIFETFIQGNILSSKAGIVDRPETSTWFSRDPGACLQFNGLFGIFTDLTKFHAPSWRYEQADGVPR